MRITELGWKRLRRRTLVSALGLAGLCLLVPGVQAQAGDPAASALPQLGDGAEMTPAAERRLGDRIARTLYHDPDYIDDPVLAEYVQGVWQPLLAAARLRGDLTPDLDEHFAWRVLLGRDRTVNAFALPGGYLGVHLGLIAVVSNRDELASVLGHELSHVTQRHIARLMARNNQQAPWLMGAMILGALAAGHNTDAGSAMIVGGQALSAQSQLNFSRDMEREADRMGFGVMTQAGYAPQGFVTMFDKLQQASRLNDFGDYPYLRSHPLTTQRIADMQSRLPLGAPHPAAPTPDLLSAIMAARARLLSNTDADALRTWQQQVDAPDFTALTPAQRAGVLYGAVLAASRLREPALVQADLQRLRPLAEDLPEARQQLRWLEVEVALADGEVAKARQPALRAALATDGASLRRPALMLLAQLAVQSGQTDLLDAAASQLLSWTIGHSRDALAWQWLSRVYAAQGQTLRALRADAEVQAAQLDYAAALDRLKAAQDRLRGAAGNSAEHIDASIIDMRRRQLEALVKEQALDR